MRLGFRSGPRRANRRSVRRAADVPRVHACSALRRIFLRIVAAAIQPPDWPAVERETTPLALARAFFIRVRARLAVVRPIFYRHADLLAIVAVAPGGRREAVHSLAVPHGRLAPRRGPAGPFSSHVPARPPPPCLPCPARGTAQEC